MKDVLLYGASWCPFCRAVKNWLDTKGIKYSYKDVDEAGVRDEMKTHVPNNETIPVIVIDGKGYVNPEISFLAQELSTEAAADKKVYDVAVVGAGPSALSAAIYTTREDLDTVLIEKGVIGGLAAITDQVDNYPGFPEGVTGLDLADNLQKQAERFGTKFEFAQVEAIETRPSGEKRVVTTDGELFARAVLVATGSDYKKLGIPGEQEFYGRGVHYCATCDGPVFRDKKLAVVGGGNSAVQEAIFLTKFASHIDLLVRGDQMRASDVLQHELENHKDKITIHFKTQPLEVVGDKFVSGIKTKSDGQDKLFECDGVFVFIGLLPNTDFLKHSLELDEVGFVKTDERLQTSMEGVFASGDVRSGATMQIASAVGEGATAALKIREYLEAKNR